MTPADQTQRERLARIERDLKNATPAFDAEAYRPAEIVYNPDDYRNAAYAPKPSWEQRIGFEWDSTEWHSSETVEPREIRISLRDVLATIGIFSMLAIAAVGFMAVGN